MGTTMTTTTSVSSSQHLIHAVRKGDLAAVIALLKEGIYDIDEESVIEGKSALVCAIEGGFYDITEQLIKYGARLNSECNARPRPRCYPLHVAAIGENSDIVKLILNNGVDVDARDSAGETPLFWSVLYYGYEFGKVKKHIDVFKMLLKAGADINAKNEYRGDTILHRVARDGRVGRFGEFLLQNGANIESRDKYDCTPLYLSVNKKGLDLKYRLELDANVNCENIDGRTPLHEAVSIGDIDYVILLLEYGADINLESGRFGISFYFMSDIDYVSKMKMWQIVISHVAKLKALNSHVSAKNMELLQSSQKCTNFYSRCIEEIQNMRIRKIHNTDITFFSLLTNHLHTISVYANNENVIQLYDDESNKKLKAEFPIYADALNHRLCRALIRRELVSECFQILWNFSSKLSPTNLEMICSYLTARDLKNFISSYQPGIIHDFVNRRLYEMVNLILPFDIYDYWFNARYDITKYDFCTFDD